MSLPHSSRSSDSDQLPDHRHPLSPSSYYDDAANPRHASDNHDENLPNHLKRQLSSSSSASSDRRSQSSDEVAAATSAHTTIPSGFGGARVRVRRPKKRPRSAPPSKSRHQHHDESVAPGAAASWERHTRGIGSKILAKLGFTGRLGKNEDGLSAPLEPRVRPRLAGVGLAPRATKVAKNNRRAKRGGNRKGDLGGDISSANDEDEDDDDSRDDDDDSEEEDDDDDGHDDDTWLEQQRAAAAANEQKRRAHEAKQKAIKEKHTVSLPSQATVAGSLFSGGRISEQLHALVSAASSRTDKHKRDIDAEQAILANAKNTADRCERLALQARNRIESTQRASELLSDISTRLQFMSMNREEPNDGSSVNDRIESVCKLVDILGEPMDKEKCGVALLSVTRAILTAEVHQLAANASDTGVASQSIARRIRQALSAVRLALSKFMDNSEESYARLITHVIVRPVHSVIEAPAWDCVRGAAVADMLAVMKDSIPPAALQIIGSSVSLALTESSSGNTRMAVLPWIHVVGRRALGNILRKKRVELSSSISTWRLTSRGVEGNSAETAKLVSDIGAWLPVLSGSGRSRIHAVVAQYPVPQICNAMSTWRRWNAEFLCKEASDWLKLVPQSKHSATRSVIFGKVSTAIVNGPGNAAKNAPDWHRAADVYATVRDWIPSESREGIQNALAALLFVVHAKRTCHPRSWTDVAVPESLLRNCFSRRGPGKTGKRNNGSNTGTNGDVSDQEAKADSCEAKAKLIEVVEMIGREKGISVTRLREHNGVTRVRFGRVEAQVDESRNFVVVRNRRVSIDRLIEMGRR